MQLNVAGQRRITPLDGRDWENLELRRHNDAVARDSILRERTALFESEWMLSARRTGNREACISPIPYRAAC
ncbi:MAG: hypothetical protein GEU90_16220 [Gemmatimonas sp.]|nr:hypothetical protein [Gemmatimonas sp.]